MATDYEWGTGITVTAPFDYGALKPLDSRVSVNTIEERDAHVTNNRAYPGMLVYVADTGETYRFNGAAATTLWSIMPKGESLDATYEKLTNKVTSLSSASTNTQYPSAKCVYDAYNGKTIPAGGTAGQVLAKKTATDYDLEWVAQSGGGGNPDGTTIITNTAGKLQAVYGGGLVPTTLIIVSGSADARTSRSYVKAITDSGWNPFEEGPDSVTVKLKGGYDKESGSYSLDGEYVFTPGDADKTWYTTTLNADDDKFSIYGPHYIAEPELKAMTELSSVSEKISMSKITASTSGGLGASPIGASFIPVDGTTIYVNDSYSTPVITALGTIQDVRVNGTSVVVDHAAEFETMPAGGTAGQVLAKRTEYDWDLEWVDAGSGGGYEPDGQTIKLNSSNQLHAVYGGGEWEDESYIIKRADFVQITEHSWKSRRTITYDLFEGGETYYDVHISGSYKDDDGLHEIDDDFEFSIGQDFYSSEVATDLICYFYSPDHSDPDLAGRAVFVYSHNLNDVSNVTATYSEIVKMPIDSEYIDIDNVTLKINDDGEIYSAVGVPAENKDIILNSSNKLETIYGGGPIYGNIAITDGSFQPYAPIEDAKSCNITNWTPISETKEYYMLKLNGSATTTSKTYTYNNTEVYFSGDESGQKYVGGLGDESMYLELYGPNYAEDPSLRNLCIIRQSWVNSINVTVSLYAQTGTSTISSIYMPIDDSTIKINTSGKMYVAGGGSSDGVKGIKVQQDTGGVNEIAYTLTDATATTYEKSVIKIDETAGGSGTSPAKDYLITSGAVNTGLSSLAENLVKVSATGTSTTEIGYITVRGTEYKIAGGSLTEERVRAIFEEIFATKTKSGLVNDIRTYNYVTAFPLCNEVTEGGVVHYCTPNWVEPTTADVPNGDVEYVDRSTNIEYVWRPITFTHATYTGEYVPVDSHTASSADIGGIF